MARPVLDDTGNVLLNRGVAISANYIDALKAKGFTYMYVTDRKEYTRIALDEDIHPGLRARAVSVLRKTYEALEREVRAAEPRTKSEVQEICSSKRVAQILSPKGFMGKVGEVTEEIIEELANRDILAGLTSVKCEGIRPYQHGVDVCILCVMMGKAINMRARQLKQLAMGAIMHDIGMVFLEDGLPEAQRIKLHTVLGYEILRHTDTHTMSPHVALEHHEHQDGTGLPRHVSGSNMLVRNRNLPPPIPSLNGEIAAVANAYDNLVSGTHEQKPLSPNDAVNLMRGASGLVFNKEILNIFLSMVPAHPVGSEVRIRDGRYDGFSGVVVEQRAGRADRPIVVLFTGRTGEPIEPVEVHLKEETDATLVLGAAK